MTLWSGPLAGRGLPAGRDRDRRRNSESLALRRRAVRRDITRLTVLLADLGGPGCRTMRLTASRPGVHAIGPVTTESEAP